MAESQLSSPDNSFNIHVGPFKYTFHLHDTHDGVDISCVHIHEFYLWKEWIDWSFKCPKASTIGYNLNPKHFFKIFSDYSKNIANEYIGISIQDTFKKFDDGKKIIIDITLYAVYDKEIFDVITVQLSPRFRSELELRTLKLRREDSLLKKMIIQQTDQLHEAHKCLVSEQEKHVLKLEQEDKRLNELIHESHECLISVQKKHILKLEQEDTRLNELILQKDDQLKSMQKTVVSLTNTVDIACQRLEMITDVISYMPHDWNQKWLDYDKLFPIPPIHKLDSNI